MVPVVSLLDGDPLMRGSVVAAECDGTVDGGRWRSVAFAAVNHQSVLAVMGGWVAASGGLCF
jgi:hypothetical protein